MDRICLFPGTFDPVTLGHTDIINRALPLFDKLVIGIGRNSNKTSMFTEEQRLEWLREIYKEEPKIKVLAYDGLTVNCCKSVGANFILRGIRYVNDFEYEKAIAEFQKSLQNNPKHEKTLQVMAQTLLAQNKVAEAEKFVARLKESNANNQYLAQLETQIASLKNNSQN